MRCCRLSMIVWFALAIASGAALSLPAAEPDAPPAASPAATPDPKAPAAETPAASEKPQGEKAPADKPADGKAADDKTPAAEPAKGAGAPAGKRVVDDEYFELFETFVDTLDQVERNYVKPVSRRELMEAAIDGLLSKLDPYSSYIGREDISRFKSTVESQFGGIGIDIARDREGLEVASPLVGTPAYRAHLQAGDRILEIDGQSIAGLSHDDCVRRLRGEVGTSVTLLVKHPDVEQPETVALKREIIHVDTVRGDRRKGDDTWDFMLNADQHIGYIRITAFSRDTAHDLKTAMEDLESRGLKGLIIDLRFNPGGLLTSAIEISDMFISEGRIVSTQGRNTPERTWDAEKPGTYEGFPIVILVNRYSASASEIVAACLQDHHRAIVVGERTWGKGSVQNVIEMDGGRSALKLTTASYKRPNGKNIHRFPDAKDTDEWGVHPNDGFEVKVGNDEMGTLIHDRHERDVLARHPAVGRPPASEKPATEKPAEGEKPAAAATDQKAPNEKASDEKVGDRKPAEEKPGAEKSADKKPFVDRQLQKAVDYLTQQLARAQ
ncbi:MAG TPA: S41 family peptidase [Pirellulales bacterium]|nr:S41 family peptidase [Pirellulales bacterium]